MKCRICDNEQDNISLRLKENLHKTNEEFDYFQCSRCECIQILEIPADLGKYYPSDYYSFNPNEGEEFLQKELGFFKKVQTDYLIHDKNVILGKLFTIGYPSHKIFGWLRNMSLSKDAAVLDIGCGTGKYLKQMNQLGYRNLTGVDPFISQDYIFSDTFRIFKKDPLELDESKKFDCIMMHHSFEHMVEEKEVLKKSRSLLKPGGTILIRIPIYSKPLLEKYGVHLVSLDAPRHLYIHSVKSMEIICKNAGLKIDKVEYDADPFSFWASEQYIKGITSSDKNSFSVSKKDSIFSKDQIKQYKKEIRKMNIEGTSDNGVFYISPE